MTRSIFDPSGEETEHSGSRYSGPAASDLSNMPPDVIDGVVSEEEAADMEQAAETDQTADEALSDVERIDAAGKTNPEE